MNQEKIGKFIATLRKEQNLTQEELAEKLGITAKAVSKWECGKGLPDASIMLELCKILKITVNDLLSGERVDKENYQKKLEKNIIDTIDYSNKIVDKKNQKIAKFIMLLGIFLIFNAFSIFPTESSWGSIYSVVGLLISTLGFINLKKNKIFNINMKDYLLVQAFFTHKKKLILQYNFFRSKEEILQKLIEKDHTPFFIYYLFSYYRI